MSMMFFFLLLSFHLVDAIDFSVKVGENNFDSALTDLNVVQAFNLTFQAAFNRTSDEEKIILNRYIGDELVYWKVIPEALNQITDSNQTWVGTFQDEISLNSIPMTQTTYKYQLEVVVDDVVTTSENVTVTLKRTVKLNETESVVVCGTSGNVLQQGTFMWQSDLLSAPNVDCLNCNSSCNIDFPNDGVERTIKTVTFGKLNYIYKYGVVAFEEMSLSNTGEYEFQLVDMVVKVTKTFVCAGSLKVKKTSTTDTKSRFLFLSSSKATFSNSLFFNLPAGFYGETTVKNGAYLRLRQRVYADGPSGHLILEDDAKMYLDYDLENPYGLTYPTSNDSTIDLLVPVVIVDPLIGYQVDTAHYIFTTKYKISGSGSIVQVKGNARLHYAIIYVKSVIQAITLSTSTPTPTSTKTPLNSEEVAGVVKPKSRPMKSLGVITNGNSQLLCGTTFTENSYDIQSGATLIVDNTVSGANVCSVGNITSESGVIMKASSNTGNPSTVTANSGSTVSFIKVSETNMFDIKGNFIIQTGTNLLVDVTVTPVDAVIARYESTQCLAPSSTFTITKNGGICSDATYTCKYEFNQEGSKHCQIRVFTELKTTPAVAPTSNSPEPSTATGTGTGVTQTVTTEKSSSSDSNNGLWGLMALLAIPLLIIGGIVLFFYFIRNNAEDVKAEENVKEYVAHGSANTPTPSPYVP